MVRLVFFVTLLLQSGYTAAGDPTRPKFDQPVVSKKVETPKKHKRQLTAIFERNKQRFAIIDNQSYRVGDQYLDSKITKITTNKVFLKSVEGTHHLTLFGNFKSKK